MSNESSIDLAHPSAEPKPLARVYGEALNELPQDLYIPPARFKRPKEYHVVQTLPTNNYGKVLKRELRGQLTDGTLPAQR